MERNMFGYYYTYFACNFLMITQTLQTRVAFHTTGNQGKKNNMQLERSNTAFDSRDRMQKKNEVENRNFKKK